MCLFILLGLKGDPDPWPGELRKWAVCPKSLAVPLPVMGVKRGPQDDSLEVSRLTLPIPQNVRLTWDMKIVGVVCLLWPEGCNLGLR